MPTQTEAVHRAEQLIMAERYADAVAELEEVLDENPGDVEVLNDLGIALFKMKDWDRTLDTYLRALETDPTRSILWENVAEVVQTGALSHGRLRALYGRLAADRVIPPQRDVLKHIGQKAPEVACYRAAYAQCDITPNSACKTQGWMEEEQEADEAVAPLLLQALLLEDEAHNNVLIVAADLFGVGDTLMEIVHWEARQWGIPPETVMFNASHTHYAPGTVEGVLRGLGPYYPEYAKQIGRAIRQLLTHLHENLQPCLLYAGKTTAQIGVNRRRKRNGSQGRPEPRSDGYYHGETPLLMLDFLEDRSTVGLVNHGCPPAGSGHRAFLSPGYPGYLRDTLTAAGVANRIMFLQGAAGRSALSLNKNGNARLASSPADAERCAANLADAVRTSLGGELDVVSGRIFARTERVELPFERLPSRDQLQERAVATGEGPQTVEQRWAHSMLREAEEYDEALEMEVQLVGFGEDTCFLTFPAEPDAALARDILDAVRIASNTFILGYTNGLKAYLPTREVVVNGAKANDEATMIHLLPASFDSTVEDRVIDGVARLVEHWKDPDRPNGYGRYHLAQEQGEAFFCLSTGRCGTQTLARLLTMATNARVYHHPRPYLVKETLAAYRGTIDRRQTFWRARGGAIRDAWKDGLIFGETDHNMTAFASAIHQDLEKAKYVVLVRNPWDFVRSGMRRQYYRNHSWDKGRLRPDRQHPDFEAWHGMTRFEKVCWLWNETYRRVDDFITDLPEETYRIVQFEQLVEDEREAREIFEFLGLRGFDAAAVRSILGRKLNRQTHGAYPKPAEWERKRHEALWSICRHSVERLDLDDYEEMYESYLAGDVSGDGRGRAGSAEGAPRPGRQPDAPGLRPDHQGAQPHISTTTIWDYKKFKYQAFPAALSPSDIVASNAKRALINRKTPIASMGSCFARNVARYLLEKGYNYLVTERPFQQASARWDRVYNTACMRQIFEYSLTETWDPQVRWWPKGNEVQDPFRRDILYPADTCEEHFERHREASRTAIQEARVIILTLGLIETWRDKRDHATYYRVPSPSIYDSDIHEFYVQTLQDCLGDLDAIHELLHEYNPSAEVVVTVSPVPLFATFRMDVDVVSANRLSKSTLRVAAEYFTQKHENVHYFPAYEIVTEGAGSPYQEDNRHVTEEAITAVMRSFEALFVA